MSFPSVEPRKRCSVCGNATRLDPCDEVSCKDTMYCSDACRDFHRPFHISSCGTQIPDNVLRCPAYIDFSRGPPLSDLCSYCRNSKVYTFSSACDMIGLSLWFYVERGIPSCTKCTEEDRSGHVNIASLLALADDGSDFQNLNWGFGHVCAELFVVRDDGKILTPETFETVVEFLRLARDEFSGDSGRDGWAPLREFLTPATFQLFLKMYFKEQRKKGRPGFFGPFTSL